MFQMARLTPEQALKMLANAEAAPLEPYPGSQAKPWRAKCINCSAEITPRLVNIKHSRACKFCRGHGRHSPESALKVLKTKDLVALGPYPGGIHEPWSCQCTQCGLEVAPRLASLLKGQGGCRRCGMRYEDAAAIVYLFHHQEFKALKIGITNKHGYRLQKYPGWDLARVVETETGREAQYLEKLVLRSWRIEMGLKPFLQRTDMPDKGWTETAHESGLDQAVKILDEFKKHRVKPKT